MYDQRTNDDIDRAFRDAERRVEILIVGHLYVIDFENMLQYRLNDTQRRRRIKYDLMSAPKKGVGGLKLDRQRCSERKGSLLFSSSSAPFQKDTLRTSAQHRCSCCSVVGFLRALDHRQ